MFWRFFITNTKSKNTSKKKIGQALVAKEQGIDWVPLLLVKCSRAKEDHFDALTTGATTGPTSDSKKRPRSQR
jgi:hypothetical protein